MSAELGEQHSLNWQKKFLQMEQSLQEWEELSLGDADYVIVAYGTSARIAESVIELAAAGISVGLVAAPIRFGIPIGFPSSFPRVRFLAPERAGQLVEDVASRYWASSVKHYGRLGGMVPERRSPGEITAMRLPKEDNNMSNSSSTAVLTDTPFTIAPVPARGNSPHTRRCRKKKSTRQNHRHHSRRLFRLL